MEDMRHEVEGVMWEVQGMQYGQEVERMRHKAGRGRHEAWDMSRGMSQCMRHEL